MRSNLGTIFGRVVAVIGGLLLAGIVLRLIVSVLQPVLPAKFAHDLADGFDFLYSMVSPAIPAIGAFGILAVMLWTIASRRR